MNPLRLISKYFNPFFSRINKRLRFVISVFIMIATMLLATQPLFFDKSWFFVPLLMIMTYFFTYFSVLEGIEKREWIMLFIMPVLVTVAFYTFYFLFPIRWLTRIPFTVFYGFSLYAILLTSNIFNVGVERSLQLYRAAFSVNYFYQTVIYFLLLNVILIFKEIFFLNAIAVFILTLPMCLQLLWSVKPKTTIDSKVVKYSFFVSIMLAEATVILSFLPLKSTIFALFLTGIYYSLSGLIYHYLDEKLFKPTVREYLFVTGFVIILLLLSIQW